MKAYVSSVGFTSVADHWDKSLLDLAHEAASGALKGSSGIRPQQVFVGNMFSALGASQEQLGALVANSVGLGGVPAVKVESACASGAAAFNLAYSMVKGGVLDSALVVGVEKMRDVEPDEISKVLSLAESSEYTQFVGASFAALNGMLARYYMEQMGVTRDELSAFPVIDHANSVPAEHAQFRRAITPEVVARSSMVADPLRLFDCSPVGDGAAAAVLVNDKAASSASDGLVEICGGQMSTTEFSMHEREDMLHFKATEDSFKAAMQQAGLSLPKLDFAEIHDAFSVMGALSLEAMGYSRRGEAGADAREGRYNLNSDLPINTFGGLKARGNPIGATGVYQVAEAYLQLTDAAGKNQVVGAQYGAVQNLGGVDTTSVVHVLGRAE
jgi:acetyl-CoA C-acetyltransferase